jgi:hypothetical protein
MEIPRHWRLKEKRYRLEGSVCPHCQTPSLSGPPVCAECGGESKKHFSFSGEGKVNSYTQMPDTPSSSPFIDNEVLKMSTRITNFASIPDTTREVIPYSEIISKDIHSGVIYQAV